MIRKYWRLSIALKGVCTGNLEFNQNSYLREKTRGKSLLFEAVIFEKLDRDERVIV